MARLSPLLSLERLLNEDDGFTQILVLPLTRLVVRYCSLVLPGPTASISWEASRETWASRPTYTAPSTTMMSSMGNPAWIKLLMIVCVSSASAACSPPQPETSAPHSTA